MTDIRDTKCPKCDGEGETFSGYYKHPETHGEGGPLMHECSLCKRWGYVAKKVATKYICSRIVDPF